MVAVLIHFTVEELKPHIRNIVNNADPMRWNDGQQISGPNTEQIYGGAIAILFEPMDRFLRERCSGYTISLPNPEHVMDDILVMSNRDQVSPVTIKFDQFADAFLFLAMFDQSRVQTSTTI
jgi:hypothetical protein